MNLGNFILRIRQNSLFQHLMRFIALITLGALTIYQIRLGAESYAILFLIFFLFIVFSKTQHSPLILLFIALVIVYKTSIPEFGLKILDSNISTIKSLDIKLQNLFTANTGQEVLPAEVLQVLDLINSHEIQNYQLSYELQQDIYILQRIVESSWPIMRDIESHFLFTFVDEIIKYPDCKIIDQTKDIALAYCD